MKYSDPSGHNVQEYTKDYIPQPTGYMYMNDVDIDAPNFTDDIYYWIDNISNAYPPAGIIADVPIAINSSKTLLTSLSRKIAKKEIAKSAEEFLSKPVMSNGTLNIGAGTKPISGAYNIDINPTTAGVYVGDATSLSNIASGSQSRIVIQNQYNYNALNSEVGRVLQSGGTVEITGGMSNKWFNSIYNMSETQLNSIGYSIVSKGTANNTGAGFTTQGQAIKSSILEIILKKD